MADPPEVSSSNPSPPSIAVDGSDHDSLLAKSEFLTRQELLIRRSRRIKQLRRIYRNQYWTLMKFLKHKYREYYWEFGKSPFKDDEINGANNTVNCAEETREDKNLGTKPGLVYEGLIRKCAAAGCKAKAMALTRFCHPHILSDPKQKLYKGCTQIVKRYALCAAFCAWLQGVLRLTRLITMEMDNVYMKVRRVDLYYVGSQYLDQLILPSARFTFKKMTNMSCKL